MAQTKYTYSVATDTLNAVVDVDTLDNSVRTSAIVTALDYTNVFGDVLDIFMKDALSVGDETILDGVVAAHTGDPGPDAPTEVVNVADPAVVNASNTLRVSQVVLAGTTISDTLVIANGSVATVKIFEASCPDSPLCIACLVWDPGEVGEEILWVFQREGIMPQENAVTVTGDGVKKLAVCCDNGDASDFYFNAFAKVEVV